MASAKSVAAQRLGSRRPGLCTPVQVEGAGPERGSGGGNPIGPVAPFVANVQDTTSGLCQRLSVPTPRADSRRTNRTSLAEGHDLGTLK